MTKSLYQIIIRPVLTEKSVSGVDSKKYVFEVANDATKIEIKNAVEELFKKEKIKVASVNTSTVRGKSRRMNLRSGRRPSTGMTPSWKKAVVTLTADSPNLSVLEGV